ncbi:MAG: glycosyl transferase [Gemmatimonadetes bacterium]|nr:glycosyl transferase [Gemmatimonadota bacterium]
MADFYQTGVITTLHRLGEQRIEEIEGELVEFAQTRPLTLVIPALASEMDGPALQGVVRVLREVPYVYRVVIGLDAASRADFERARTFFGALPQRVDILWRDGERIQKLYRQLDAANIFTGTPGKGRIVWMALGCVLADPHSRTIALHDADIVTYQRDLLARLCYPVMNPSLGYEYAKGFYARITDRMYGRVARLFVTPLIRTLLKSVGYHPYLVFLDSFRYPLAGEFAMDEDLARVMRIPSDWGLEIGLLGEVFRNLATRRVCEVDVADAYEHKHKTLAADWPESGLFKMAVDIAKSLFVTLAQEGVEISEGFFRSLRAAYLRMAQDQVRRYADDAAVNHLKFDRHEEGTAVEIFAKAIELAAGEVLQDPLGSPTIPQWARVTSALPDILEELSAAVEADNH